MEGWLDFDKILVAQTSLEMLSHSLSSIKTKPSYWQWVYIALHSAVQGYMVLALTGSNSLLTYREKDAKKWLENYENNTALPDCRLDNFMSLYEKVKSDRFLLYENTQKYVPSGFQENSLYQVNKLRNNFVHYKYWNYTLVMGNSQFQIVNDCLDFIEFLALRSNNVFWGDETYKKNTEEILDNCRSLARS